MFALIRYSVPDPQTEEFIARARKVLDLLAAQPGYVRGRIGRSVDEPELWALVSEWEGAGFYRRALSAVRMAMYPLMTLMINEPSAFECAYRAGEESGQKAGMVRRTDSGDRPLGDG